MEPAEVELVVQRLAGPVAAFGWWPVAAVDRQVVVEHRGMAIQLPAAKPQVD
jgi:hypothetical protein